MGDLILSFPDSFWSLVTASATREPDRVVLADDYGRTLTTVQLRDSALGYAASLNNRGVRAGSVVSWQLPSTLEAMVVMAALTRLGAMQNPVLPILREREVRFITKQIGTECLITCDSWKGFDHGELALMLAAEFGFDVLSVEQGTTPPHAPSLLRLPMEDPDRLPPPPGASRADEVRWVYFSSGTTADPKGVRHTDRSVMSGAAGVVGMVGANTSDVDPLAFPISHIGGSAMLAAALLTGMRLVLFDSFDPVTSPWRIAAHRPTLLGSATPFFVAFIEAQRSGGGPRVFGDLRACIGGGAPVTAELNRQVRQVLGVPGIANAWGLTEFPVATSPRPDAPPEVLDHTVGPPVPGVSVRVAGSDGRELGRGQEGELRLKGPQCFAGYVDSSLDRDAFDSDGWFCTGDLGMVDHDGNVRVTGRIKDAIIRNAENISAQEIEEVLITHGSVADVAVIGVPDDRTGERVCAVVVKMPNCRITLPELVDHCRQLGLARYKHPEALEVVDELPRNLSGKVLKRELRATFSP